MTPDAPVPATVPGDDIAGNKLNLRELQDVLTSGSVKALALGWSEAGNEELRLYNEVDGVIARIEAMGGYCVITVGDDAA